MNWFLQLSDAMQFSIIAFPCITIAIVVDSLVKRKIALEAIKAGKDVDIK